MGLDTQTGASGGRTCLDSSLVEALYSEHGSLCYRLARSVIVDEHLAQDVVQDVFVAVWSGRAGVFDPGRGSMRSWLLHVTHHKAVDSVRRAQRHSARNAGPDMFAGIASEHDVESDAWDSQRRDQITTALAGLSAEQRRVLEMAYFGGHTQAEIAQITSTPLGTVKTRTWAAFRNLRNSLELAAIVDADGWTGSAATLPASAT